MGAAKQRWALLEEDHLAIVAGLERGEVDCVLPALSTWFDRFITFLQQLGITQELDDFPDHRERRSIPASFFLMLLLLVRVLRLPGMRQCGEWLFRSPAVLRRMGFTARQIKAGFYANAGLRPFNEEAAQDFYAETSLRVLEELQRLVVKRLLSWKPKLWRGRYSIDGIKISLPGARGVAPRSYKLVVLSLNLGELALPLLWRVLDSEYDHELPAARQLMAAAQEVLGKATIRWLMVDRGLLDGGWFTELAQAGTWVVSKAKEDMICFQDAIGLTRLAGTRWQEVPPPKIKGEKPVRRIAWVGVLETWENCRVPLRGCVVHDRYRDREQWQVIITTGPVRSAGQLLELYRSRWEIEEAFMDLSRYWGLNHLPGCRPGMAAACLHFSLLAYLLVKLYQREHADSPRRLLPVPETELLVCIGDRFALLTFDQVLEIIFAHLGVWQARLPRILATLRGSRSP